jgi:sodium:dicarboxylate symporter family protein
VPSSTQNILVGLALGLLAGLFLGEKAEALQLVVRAYLGLLQMTVLPYVMVSLIAGGSAGWTAPRHASCFSEGERSVSCCGHWWWLRSCSCPSRFRS